MLLLSVSLAINHFLLQRQGPKCPLSCLLACSKRIRQLAAGAPALFTAQRRNWLRRHQSAAHLLGRRLREQGLDYYVGHPVRVFTPGSALFTAATGCACVRCVLQCSRT